MPDLAAPKPALAVEIVGRILTDGRQVKEHVLGVAEGANTYELSTALEALLQELADTWPEVVAAGGA